MSNPKIIANINPKKVISAKLNIATQYIPPKTQSKSVTPTKEIQIVIPDETYTGLSSVEVGAIKTQNKQVEITSNTTTNVQVDSNYDGIEEISITTNVTPNLQSKDITITQNGTTTVTHDTGYDGLSNVEVTVDVPSSSQGFPPDWTQLGYEDTPDTIINGFNYAKQIKDNWNPNVTSLNNRFNKDTNLLVFPFVDTSKVTDFSGFCRDARHLIYIPLIDTSQATTLQNAFAGVTIEEFPELDTSSCTKFNGAFSNNKTLKHFKIINTSRGTDFSGMFKDSEQLQDVELLDLSSATNLSNMFQNCSILTDYSLNNIMQMCINATSYTGTKTLRQLGLSSNRATRATQLENYTAFVEAGWTTGY